MAKIKAYSTSVKDDPSAMSMYKRESLAADAVIAAEKKKKKSKKNLLKPLRRTSPF